MILYKYYGFSAGLSALKSSQLGFRIPISFNDPFELSFLDNAEGPEVKLNDLDFKIKELKKSVAILSLTRTPLNPLMWAHYGEDHTGFVIGYKVDSPFLNDENYNLIPVDRGDVVYTNTKTLHQLNKKSRELLHQVYLASQGLIEESPDRSDFENLARKIFLTKHSSWVYEEEVRVVKSFFSMFEDVDEYYSDPMRNWYSISQNVAPMISVEKVSGLKIFNHEVDIKEVYLGVRNPLIANCEDDCNILDRTLSEKAIEKNWNINILKIPKGSWNLESQSADSKLLEIKPQQRGLIKSFSLSGKDADFIFQNLKINDLSEHDNIEVTNWENELFLKINGEFI